MDHHWLAEAELGPVQPSNLFRFGANPIEHVVDFLLLQIPQLQSERDFAGNDVVGTRLNLDPAHRAYLSSRNAGDDLIYFFNESGCSQQTILASVHRRCAGVVGKSLN